MNCLAITSQVRLATHGAVFTSAAKRQSRLLTTTTTTTSINRHNHHLSFTIVASAAAGAAAAVPEEPTTTTPTTNAADVQGDMLVPSVANNPFVRALTILATVTATAYSTSFLPSAAVGFVHMLLFGSWFGTQAWTSFVFGIVAFRNLPRQTFGKLQSKLFPKYFIVTAGAPCVLLATLYFATSGAPPRKEVILLAISAVTGLLNLFFIEPAATNVMFQRYALENAPGARDDAGIKALYKQFGKWHGISSLMNLGNLVCAVGHAYYLGALLAF